MEGQLLVNGTQKYRVVESCEKGGVTAMAGACKYAGRMPTLRQAAPFFLNDGLWKANETILQQIRPIITNTHTAVSRVPLSASLVTSANIGDFLKKETLFKPPSETIMRVVEESKGQFMLEIFKDGAWLFPISPEFLDAQKIRMSDSGRLFVVESNFTVIYEGSGCYRTAMENPLRDMQAGFMATKLRTSTGEHPILFGEGGESFIFYLWHNSKGIKVSFATLGSDYYDYDERLNVVVSNRPDVLFGALVKEQG